MRIHSVAYDIRATSTLYKIFQVASSHLLNRHNIHLFSTKTPQKIKKIQPTRPLQPPTQPSHHATRNLSPLSLTKHPSIHASNTDRISVPANIGRRQLVGLKPGPLQPGASTKGGDGGIVVQDPGCAVTLQSVALRCGPRIWSKMFGWGGGGSYRVPSAVCATSGWAGRSGSGG